MTFLSLGKSRRTLKKALDASEAQVRSLQGQVRALEESKTQLCSQLAAAKEKKGLAGEAGQIDAQSNGLGAGAGDKKHVESEPALTPGRDEIERLKERVEELTERNRELEAASTLAVPSDFGTSKKDDELEGAAAAAVEERSSSDAAQTECSANANIGSEDVAQLNQHSNVRSVSWDLAEEGENSEQAAANGWQTDKDNTHDTVRELIERNKELEATVSALSEKLARMQSTLATEGGRTSLKVVGGGELAERNQELEKSVASLSADRDKLLSILEKERNKSLMRRTEAKERRKRFESKLNQMSEKLREDFGDEGNGDVDVDTLADVDLSFASGSSFSTSFLVDD